MKPFITLALTASLAFPTWAQITTAENFKMPCSRVVKLGLDKFMDEYSKKTNDYSTQGQNRGYEIYANCKRNDNNNRAKVLSTAKQQQLASIRKNLNTFENSCWGLVQLQSGGGTMWNQIATSAMAVREDFYGSFITTLGKPQRSSTARRKANALLSSTRMRLRKWQNIELSEYGGLTPTEQKKLYRDSWNSAHASLVGLLNISKTLPDNAALQLAQRINRSISNALEFDEARSTSKKTSGIYGHIKTITRTANEEYGATKSMAFSDVVVKSKSNSKFMKKTQSNRYGDFTISLPPGKYIVTATVPTTSLPKGWHPESVEQAVTVWQGFYTKSNLIVDIN